MKAESERHDASQRSGLVVIRLPRVGTGRSIAARPVLMEIELNEPSLALALAEGSAQRFAHAICNVNR